MNSKLAERNFDCTSLKTIKAEHESKIAQDTEEIASLKREMVIKSRQLREIETRCTKVVDELDQFRYKIQDLQKENTEMKLKIDV